MGNFNFCFANISVLGLWHVLGAHLAANFTRHPTYQNTFCILVRELLVQVGYSKEIICTLGSHKELFPLGIAPRGKAYKNLQICLCRMCSRALKCI